MRFDGKRALVVGLGKSGVAAAKVLCGLGCQVIANDLKEESQLKAELAELSEKGIKFVLGGHPEWMASEVDFIVISPGVSMHIPLIKAAKELGVVVMSEVEVGYRLCKAPVIAVTGTKGKSTTTSLAGRMLEESGRFRRVVVSGNIGKPFSAEAMDMSKDDIALVEISSFQLEGAISFHPMISALLNISSDHLDRHESLEEYIAAKKRIFANQTDQNYAVLNADDCVIAEMANQIKAVVVSFSCKREVDFGCFLRGDFLTARWGCEEFSICKKSGLKLLGSHNVYNVLAASCLALALGVSKEVVSKSALSFSGLEHTFELVSERGGIRFVNDSKATNVESLRAALEAIDSRAVLIMGGVDKGNDYRLLKALIAKKVKKIILIGTDNRRIAEVFGSTVEMDEVGGISVMEEAVKRAYLSAKPGDWVLLSPGCASFDRFKDFRERGEAFKRAVHGLE